MRAAISSTTFFSFFSSFQKKTFFKAPWPNFIASIAVADATAVQIYLMEIKIWIPHYYLSLRSLRKDFVLKDYAVVVDIIS